MARFDNLTPEQIRNSYEFKIVSRILKEKYPYITKIDFDDADLNQYRTIFLAVTVNPFIIQKMYGWKIIDFIPNMLFAPYYMAYITSAFDAPFKIGIKINDEMNDVVSQIHETEALPHELKLPRNMKVFSYNITKDSYALPQGMEPEFVEYKERIHK